MGAGPRQEVGKERLVSVGGGRWTLMEVADEPVIHARLAGEGDALCRREDAVERPVLGGWCEGAAEGGDSTGSMFRAGGGLVERLARMPLGVRSFPVAAEDIVVLAAADKCKGVVVAEGGGTGRDCRCNFWHLIDSVREFAAEGIEPAEGEAGWWGPLPSAPAGREESEDWAHRSEFSAATSKGP